MNKLLNEMMNDIVKQVKAEKNAEIMASYLAANPEVAESLLAEAREWKAAEDAVREAEAKVATCTATLIDAKTDVTCKTNEIAELSRRLNAMKGELLCLQKKAKAAQAALDRAKAELDAVKG